MVSPFLTNAPSSRYLQFGFYLFGATVFVFLAAIAKSFIEMFHYAFIATPPNLVPLAFAALFFLAATYLHCLIVRGDERELMASAAAAEHEDRCDGRGAILSHGAGEVALGDDTEWGLFEEKLRRWDQGRTAREEILVAEVAELEKDVWQGGPRSKKRSRAA